MGLIANMIRTARESAGLTRAEAAERLGVDWRRVWEWEESRRAPRDLDAVLARLQSEAAGGARRRERGLGRAP